MTAAAPEFAQHAAGLVCLLDSAGRTIAELEARVNRLTDALVEERTQRAELEVLIARLRAEQPAA